MKLKNEKQSLKKIGKTDKSQARLTKEKMQIIHIRIESRLLLESLKILKP